MNNISVLVISGDGLNCEKETAYAFSTLGANTDIYTINEIVDENISINDYDILAIPGGFSFGDEISSAQILTLKLRKYLYHDMDKFIKDLKPVIGVCNGFQALLKLGFLPNNELQDCITLTNNDNERFIDKWVKIDKAESNCIWTKNLSNTIELPIRHGEGRIIFDPTKSSSVISESLLKNENIALKYTNDENGSESNIAALCNNAGNVFGLMPHPEAAIFKYHNPSSTNKSTESSVGTQIFKNAINYVNQRRLHVDS